MRKKEKIKDKDKDYIISFYAILYILIKKKIFKYIILIFTIFIS